MSVKGKIRQAYHDARYAYANVQVTDDAIDSGTVYQVRTELVSKDGVLKDAATLKADLLAQARESRAQISPNLKPLPDVAGDVEF